MLDLLFGLLGPLVIISGLMWCKFHLYGQKKLIRCDMAVSCLFIGFSIVVIERCLDWSYVKIPLAASWLLVFPGLFINVKKLSKYYVSMEGKVDDDKVVKVSGDHEFMIREIMPRIYMNTDAPKVRGPIVIIFSDSGAS